MRQTPTPARLIATAAITFVLQANTFAMQARRVVVNAVALLAGTAARINLEPATAASAMPFLHRFKRTAGMINEVGNGLR